MREILLVLVIASSLTVGTVEPRDAADDAFAVNRVLGRGINLGNALEAPREGAWGLTLEADYFRLIKQAGFDSVRLPIRWSAHAAEQPPYEIDQAFFERVDWAVAQARANNVPIVINVHHYDEIFRDPDKHLPRLLALWKQIAQRYSDQPDRVLFELLNEPHENLTDERWNQMIPQLLAAIRESNPKRVIIVGPGHWNDLAHLEQLHLPDQDRRLVVTFHYYRPFQFTHQDARWIRDSRKWKGTTWTSTSQELDELRKDFDKAAAWGKKNHRPLFLGEFGAYSAADMQSRANWTNAVARAAEQRGMSWCYWEFASGFGAYDRKTRSWHEPLLHALLGKNPSPGSR